MPTIALTHQKQALIDAEDLALVQPYRWHASRERNRFRAQHSYRHPVTRKTTGLLMHRLILGAKPGDIVDHINGDPLDNRRSNLRIVSARSNCINKRGRGSSAFLGVSKSPEGWVVSIARDGESVRVGCWQSEEIAAAAYNRAARSVHPEFDRFNPVPDISDADWNAAMDLKRKAIKQLNRALVLLGEAQ